MSLPPLLDSNLRSAYNALLTSNLYSLEKRFEVPAGQLPPLAKVYFDNAMAMQREPVAYRMKLVDGTETFGVKTRVPRTSGVGKEVVLKVFGDDGMVRAKGTTTGGLNFDWEGYPLQGPDNIVPGVG